MRLRLDAPGMVPVQSEAGDRRGIEVGGNDVHESGLLQHHLEFGEIDDVLMAAALPLLGRLKGDAPIGELLKIEAIELLIEFLLRLA